MCAMMHGSSMFETVTTGISGHSAQDEPTAATIAKRFSALAHRCLASTAVMSAVGGSGRASVDGGTADQLRHGWLKTVAAQKHCSFRRQCVISFPLLHAHNLRQEGRMAIHLG